MQAWKIRYASSNQPDRRWTAGILAVSKEDALKHLQNVTKFPYAVEGMEYLGEIHAITEPILMSVVKARQNVQQKSVQKPTNSVEPEVNATTIEDEIQTGEIECQYCGRICKGKVALEKHEASCKMNPDFAKLEKARQDKRKEKLAEKEETSETPLIEEPSTIE